MNNTRSLMRVVITSALIATLACTSAACAQPSEPKGFSAAPQAQSAPEPKTPDLGACAEITLDLDALDPLGVNGAVNVKNTGAVVVYTNVGAGSHIGITGENSCLWITGAVAPDVAISVSGENSAVVIEGTVHPSARIEVGAGSVTWIPKVTQLMPQGIYAPDLRISSDNGGRLIINGLEEIPR